MTLEVIEYDEIIPMDKEQALEEVLETLMNKAYREHTVIPISREENEAFLNSNVRQHLEDNNIRVRVPRGKGVIIFQISGEYRRELNTPKKKD